jgi:GcrA cell cycle regulator
MGWTEERVELLKKLWGEGLSASQIAARLGGGVTRNAVIGKVHRLSLSGRAKQVSNNPRPRKVRTASPHRPTTRHYISGNTALKTHAQPAPRRLPPVPIEDIVVPISLNVPLMELSDLMCKWPSGDPGTDEFAFCGHKSWNGMPYCHYHSRVAYQPPDRRRDRRNERY